MAGGEFFDPVEKGKKEKEWRLGMADGEKIDPKRGAMAAHTELVRKGKFRAGWHVLRLLLKGMVTLGLSDAEYDAECALERNGLRGCCGRNGNYSRFGLGVQ